MTDPRVAGILIRKKPADGPGFTRSGDDASSFHVDGRTVVTRLNGSKSYRFGLNRIVFLNDPERIDLPPGWCVEVDGHIKQAVRDVYRFSASVDGSWIRIFSAVGDQERFRTYPADSVRIYAGPLALPGARDVLAYLRRVVGQMPAGSPLQRTFKDLGDVHPESALARFLTGRLLEPRDQNEDEAAAEPIFPFGTNISQRDAVETALAHPVSVIDGPPGTGKTQSILSIVANIVREPGKTVGIVSHANAAVENVRDKLMREGFSVVVADLGNSAKRNAFFEGQAERGPQVRAFLEGPPLQEPNETELTDLGRLIRRLQKYERLCAEHRAAAAALRTERRHFRRHVDQHSLPDLARFPLLRRSSRRILRFLAESEVVPVPENRALRLVGKVRRYFTFGVAEQVDPEDVEHVLALQLAFYDKRIAELETLVENTQGVLDLNDFDGLVDRHRELSRAALRGALAERYSGAVTRYDWRFRDAGTFDRFVAEYPVILSTCQSLRKCVRAGYLLDYLIIDEASQVDLPSAVLALSCARRVVVVGDVKQLPHIPERAASDGLAPPPTAYDYDRHNILSSVLELLDPGDTQDEALPRRMLREHYRCDPAIIDFCNRKFYDGRLIPMTEHKRSARSLEVRPTVEGNHMRRLPDGGSYNLREAQVISDEVLPGERLGARPDDIGIVTPFRRQVDQVTTTINDTGIGIEVDTVHKYQGREKPTMILTTVLDESRQGHISARFLDNPRLVNVAVSRAARRLVVVTNNRMLPRTRHVRELLEYIRYQNPDDVVQSKIVSIFDLLYREYSPLLEKFAQRVRGRSRYLSENAAETALREVIASSEIYDSLKVATQVPLAHLVRDPALLASLTDRQASFRRRASVDLVVFNGVTLRPVLVIEVDGHTHQSDTKQIDRDLMKNAMLNQVGQPWLRLPTDGSGEPRRIKERIDEALRTATAPPVAEFGH
ncbi:AAA domain-containing protein [Promicromonospora sukumoe]